MSDVVLKDQYGNDVTYSNVNAVLLNTVDGGTATYVSEGSEGASSNLLYDKCESVMMLELTDQSFGSESDHCYCELQSDKFDGNIETAWNKFVYANVSWDGVNYVVKPQTVSISEDGETISMTYIGNGVLFKELGAVDTGEPFFIFAGTEISADGTFICGIGGCLNSTEELAEELHTHTVSVELVLVDEKKIKPEYIEQSDWEETDTSAASYIKNKPFGTFPNQILNCVLTDTKDDAGNWVGHNNGILYEDSSDATITVGETYKIRWNDIEYICTCTYLDGIPIVGNTAAFLGASGSGEPFVIARDTIGDAFGTGTACWLAYIFEPTDDGVYDCMITSDVKKIDAKYLHQPDWNEMGKNSGSYIKNKPFGIVNYSGYVLAENITVNCTDEFDDGLYFCTIEPLEFVSGGKYNVVINGVTYTGIGSEEGTASALSIVENEEFMIICGLYGMNIFIAPAGEYTFSITAAEDCVRKIDKEYIPDGIGLPSVTSSDNNKVMTVVNGTWTAQAPASGLPSVSTADNDKVLKVVNGNWTATNETQELPVATSSDDGKALVVSGGMWTMADALPSVTASDAGKFLRVSADGAWIAESIQDVSEVGL